MSGSTFIDTDKVKSISNECKKILKGTTEKITTIYQLFGGAFMAPWEGDAADLHKEMYKDNIDDIENVVKNLQGYMEILDTVSGNYENTEKKNVTASQSLPNDVIG